MANPSSIGPKPKGKSMITKEVIIGIVSLALGAYNLLANFDYIPKYVGEVPQIVGNVLLILAGFFLLITAYRLARYKFHASYLR
ncbi:MAG: hypothetical protein KKF46_01405 [Nanoarchaeota archaeon]|nr:hypothetical protein [Nanoarchaeota archaeon]MBU1320990.1 hypothetical protein [Nanoarchaeota archaeon]MBU1596861.1 hypothetical protein [Nanoarchaeota archaeon]MBU2440800.1 hypothetical protein [Nanoarchaeota archaeon]